MDLDIASAPSYVMERTGINQDCFPKSGWNQRDYLPQFHRIYIDMYLCREHGWHDNKEILFEPGQLFEKYAFNLSIISLLFNHDLKI